MSERGQVFTLDMFFALTLTALIIGCSGMAFGQVRGWAEEYSWRYSLERIANDAADVLVKTLGVPENWYKEAENLEILGFAEENEGVPVPGTVDIKKFGQFRRLLENWENVGENVTEAVKKLFGGSEKFEIRILDENERELWYAFPRWRPGENSGAENSSEVVVVRRLASIRYGSAIRTTTGRIVRLEVQQPGEEENWLYFDVYSGEAEAYDWYIIVQGERENGNPKVQIWVNENTGNFDYQFVSATDAPEQIYPNPDLAAPHRVTHGGIENDPTIRAENRFPNPYPGTNYLYLKFTAGRWSWLQIYVVLIPECSDWGKASQAIQPLPAILELKMWR